MTCYDLGALVPATLITASPGYSDRDGANIIIDDNGHFHLFGGWDGGGSKPDNHYKSIDGVVWTKQPNAPWGARHTFGIAKLGEYWFVYGSDFGGYPSGQKGVWKSADLENWIEVNANPPFGYRWVYGACAHKQWIYLAGGYVGSGNSISPIPVNDVLRSSDGVVWETVCTNCLPEHPKVMLSGQMLSFKGDLYIMCPSTYSDTLANRLYSSKVYKSSDDGLTWAYISDIPGTPTHYGNVFSNTDYIFFKSGWNRPEGNTSRLFYSRDAITWILLDNDGLSNGHADAMIATDTFIMQASGNLFNDIKKIPITPISWECGTPTPTQTISLSVTPTISISKPLGINPSPSIPPSQTPPLPNNLLLWLDGKDDSTIVVDEVGGVSLWNDKSGWDYNAYAIYGSRPLRIEGGMYFNNSYLSLPAIVPPNDYTIIIAFETQDVLHKGTLIGFQRNDGETRFSWGVIGLNIWQPGGKIDHAYGDGITSGNGSSHSTVRYANNYSQNNFPTIITHTYDSTKQNKIIFTQGNSSEKSNTAYVANAKSITNTPEIGAIGRFGNYNGFYFNGKIYHVLVYNTVLTPSQKQAAINFINTKHGWA